MMKVRILTSCAGLDFDFVANQEVEVTDEVGQMLVNGELAEEIKEEVEVKTNAAKKGK